MFEFIKDVIFYEELYEGTTTYSSKMLSKLSQLIPGIHDSPTIS